jgi:hypothetical protein
MRTHASCPRSIASRFRARFAALSLASALGFSAVTVAPKAFAQDVSAAANAFSRAQKAELGGDHEAAAELFELADSLAPAPEALRSALQARKAAGQLGAAAVHAEALLRRYPEDKRSKELANTTLDEAKEKLSRYEIHCQPKACGLVVDGAAAGTDPNEDHVVYLDPGKHSVTGQFGSQQAAAQTVRGEAGHEGKLTFDAPPEPEKLDLGANGSAAVGGSGVTGKDSGAQSTGGGLPPWVFVTSSVVTVGLGAVAVWSGLDVLKAHDDYKGRETEAKYQDGKDKEKRTNILIAGTAAAAVTTGVFAILTDWRGKREQKVGAKGSRTLRPGASWVAGGGLMSVEGTF